MSSIRCPKCSSSNLYQERDRSFEPDPWILGCQRCGYRIYGQKTIQNLIQRQAPHLVSVYSAHVAARQAAAKERFRQPPARPPVESDTPRRGRVLVHCAECGEGIWRRPYDVRTSANKRFFCKLEHLNAFKRREGARLRDGEESRVLPMDPPKPARKRSARRGAVKVHCAVCNDPVWRRPWDVKTCKSGLFFCSGEHRLEWLRSGKRLVPKKPVQQPQIPAVAGRTQVLSEPLPAQKTRQPVTPIETPPAATIAKIYANQEAKKGRPRAT